MTERHPYNQTFVSPVEIFEAAGYRFSLDFDDEVLIDAPEQINREQLEAVIQKALYGIQCRLRTMRTRGLQVFVGGPLSGQRHGDNIRMDGRMLVKLGPKQWACYRREIVELGEGRYTCSEDPRQYFQGMATSERNAKAGKYIEASP
jgi:hypothetical protein